MESIGICRRLTFIAAMIERFFVEAYKGGAGEALFFYSFHSCHVIAPARDRNNKRKQFVAIFV